MLLNNLSYFFAFGSLSLLPFSAQAQWSYSGDTGPEYWAELSPDYQLCATGSNQSPIDINTQKLERPSWEEVDLDYQDDIEFSVSKGDHGMVFKPNHRNVVELETGRTKEFYTLDHFHLHTPSENTINGHAFDAEIHFVHKDKDSNIFVLGYFLEVSHRRPDSDVRDIIKLLKDQKPRHIDVDDIADEADHYYSFIGSLTTPPCTENVKWLISDTVLPISASDFEVLKEFTSENARPTQSLNQRTISIFEAD